MKLTRRLRRRTNRRLRQKMSATSYARIMVGIYLAEFDYHIPELARQDAYFIACADIAQDLMDLFGMNAVDASTLIQVSIEHHRTTDGELDRMISDQRLLNSIQRFRDEYPDDAA